MSGVCLFVCFQWVTDEPSLKQLGFSSNSNRVFTNTVAKLFQRWRMTSLKLYHLFLSSYYEWFWLYSQVKAHEFKGASLTDDVSGWCVKWSGTSRVPSLTSAARQSLSNDYETGTVQTDLKKSLTWYSMKINQGEYTARLISHMSKPGLGGIFL